MALSAQKNPLAEQNQNVSHVQRPTYQSQAHLTSPTRTRQPAQVSTKHLDETFVEEYFYMTLFDRESELKALPKALKGTYSSYCVQMATRLTDLKAGDFVEEKVFGIEKQSIKCVCGIKPAVIEFCRRLSVVGVEGKGHW